MLSLYKERDVEDGKLFVVSQSLFDETLIDARPSPVPDSAPVYLRSCDF